MRRSRILTRPRVGSIRRRSWPVMRRGGPSRRLRCVVALSLATSLPVVHDLTQDGELAHVIRGVIDDEDGLAQDGLPVPVRDARMEVRLRTLDDGDHLPQVAMIGGESVVPVLLGRLGVL